MTFSPLPSGDVRLPPALPSERPRAEFRRRIIALLLFPVIIASLLAVVHEGLTLSSAVRAYVGGESLWSKGQKTAVQQLYRFALTRDETDYQRYVRALAVPMADRRARLELQGGHPDVRVAAHWFILAKNHPADVADMALLFLRFGKVSYMHRAIQIWTAGDREIDTLGQIARELHQLLRSSAWDDPVRRRDVLDRIAAADARLTALEGDFSTTLGEGARWMSRGIFTVAVLVGVLLIWIGTAVSNRLLQQARASERALRESEAQLRQAQKMEAIGRLAGGVAHDFNNLLTVIRAGLDVAQKELSAGAQFSSNLVLDASRAAERAEMLTRQLLAFSRQQVVQPCILRLDTAVADMQRLLIRLIGEDIRLVTEFDATVPVVQADPGQIGQIILNLVVNAREAMPSGGTLTIRTRVQEIDGTSTQGVSGTQGASDAPAGASISNGASPPAAWAVLEVSDTGTGMDATTQTRIFEPFFTTKGDGRGTGLGLSVVYGIVSQSGGRIEVDSGVGRGTTFRVLLPACAAYCEAPPQEAQPLPIGGTETVLVVEDEDSVRSLVREALGRQGYTVLDATNGEDALRVMEAYGDTPGIDLLISDIVMPSMGGRELVRELARRGFEIPVVFLSGYTNDAAPLEDMLGERAVFLPKPFSVERLGEVVRRVLDAKARREGVHGEGRVFVL